MKYLKRSLVIAAAVCALPLLYSCSDDDNGISGEEVKNDFHLAFASGSEANSATIVQGVSDLSSGIISSQKGHELESARTARIFASADGSTIYSLNYTEGTIEKLSYLGGDLYTRVGRIDASVPLGVKSLRFTKLNEELASLHYVRATPLYDSETGEVYLKHSVVASIGILDLETMTLLEGYNKEIEVELGEELSALGYYISRIDAPVVSGSKLYYGAAVSKWNASSGKAEATDRTFTLVLDYPSLTNATAISTTAVKGATNGYRTPTQHVNEAGEILQLVSGNEEVHIVKIKDGQYLSSFDYDLSNLLGKAVASNGWFYAGRGIGYIPYEDLSKDKIQIGENALGEPSYSAMWKLARMDFNKGTVLDLNVPDNLWLTQYQSSVVRDGIFYIALSPVGSNGNIYMFDVDSESPNGTPGAGITGTGADQYYIGIY